MKTLDRLRESPNNRHISSEVIMNGVFQDIQGEISVLQRMRQNIGIAIRTTMGASFLALGFQLK